MYTVLIVDDEENIRDGILNNCDFILFGFDHVYSASNGREALIKIKEINPHLVITDIKMPLMNGLELIEEAKKLHPDILYIILSGYDDFPLVKNALKSNVLDYLLKPCSIEAINNTLSEAKIILDKQAARKKYLEEMENSYTYLKHMLFEQSLKDYIINSSLKYKDLSNNYDITFLSQKSLRLILLTIDNLEQDASLYSLNDICKKILSQTHELYLCAPCNEQIIILTEYYEYLELRDFIINIKTTFFDYYGKYLTISVGGKTDLLTIKDAYRDLSAYIRSKFYKGNGNIITTFDLPTLNSPLVIKNFDIEYLIQAIKSGNYDELDNILNDLYQQLNKIEYNIDQIRAFSIQIYVGIIQQASNSTLLTYLSGITQISECSTFREIIDIIQNTAHEIIIALYENIQCCQNNLVKQTLSLIDMHITNENLSLTMIAKKMLYVNVDYLGKLFKAETGERFSKFVTGKRIKIAKDIFLSDEHISVNEVALATGFGHNAQYFSKVFKSATGYTPVEYRSKFRRSDI